MTMSFSDDIKKFAEKAGKTQERIALEMIVDLNRLVVEKTPVDTGNARGGWTASINAPIVMMGDIGAKDKSGSRTVNKLSKVAQRAMGNVYYLTNSVSYILPLEFGTKKMRPFAMARTSVKEVKQKVRSYVGRN